MAADVENETRRVWVRAAIFGLGLFLLTRVMILAWAYLAPQDRTQSNVTWWSHNPLVRWDSGHYAGICNEGYPPEINDTTAFFPAYPLVCRVASRWINTDDALVITSSVLALLTAILMFYWAGRQCGAASAVRAIALWAAFPSAFFLSAGYAEGLFALCTAIVFLSLQRGGYWIAALASAVATATRPPGVALALVVVASAFQFCMSRKSGDRENYDWRSEIGNMKSKQWAFVLGIAVVSISGLLFHSGYLAWHYGRWDAYFVAQQTWTPEGVRRPWLKILTLHPLLVDAVAPLMALVSGEPRRMLAHDTWDGFLGLVILVVGIRGLLARDWSIPRIWFLLPAVTFLLAYLPDPATGVRLYGISRYQLAALPCFLRIADWEIWTQRRWAIVGLCVALLLLQLANVAAFVNWHEAG